MDVSRGSDASRSFDADGFMAGVAHYRPSRPANLTDPARRIKSPKQPRASGAAGGGGAPQTPTQSRLMALVLQVP